MPELDLDVLYFFNQFAGAYPFFDRLVLQLSNNNLVKGGIFSALIMFFWFFKKHAVAERQRIIAGLIGCMVTMLAARLLAKGLPMRLRPKHDETLDFILPSGANISLLDGHSSFPSDHAALFFALATLIFSISRPAGLAAYLYVVVFICFPRIYLGLHFLSDIVAGGLLGIAIVLVMNIRRLRFAVSQRMLNWERNYSGVFYAFFFLILFQISTLFEELRAMASFAGKNF